jgi:hypothetical protein
MIGSTDDCVEIALLESFPASDPLAFVAGGVLVGRPWRSDGIGSAAFDPAPTIPCPHTPLDDQPRGTAPAQTRQPAVWQAPRPVVTGTSAAVLKFLKPGIRHLLHCAKAAHRSMHRWRDARELDVPGETKK